MCTTWLQKCILNLESLTLLMFTICQNIIPELWQPSFPNTRMLNSKFSSRPSLSKVCSHVTHAFIKESRMGHFLYCTHTVFTNKNFKLIIDAFFKFWSLLKCVNLWRRTVYVIVILIGLFSIILELILLIFVSKTSSGFMTEPDLTVAPSLAQAGHRGYKSEGINDFDRKLSPKSKNASRDPLWNLICQKFWWYPLSS